MRLTLPGRGRTFGHPFEADHYEGMPAGPELMADSAESNRNPRRRREQPERQYALQRLMPQSWNAILDWDLSRPAKIV